MDNRLKIKPDKIYEFYAEILWNSNNDTKLNISLDHIYPLDYKPDDAILSQINKFCFPTGVPTYGSMDQFCFVLTDSEGLFRFGYCHYDTERRRCMFLLSYLPWFDCFYHTLHILQAYYKRNKLFLVSEILNRLRDILIPNPGVQCIRLCQFDDSFTRSDAQLQHSYDQLYSVPPLPIPDSLTLPKITECSNLQLCYSKLDPDTLVSIFASLLHERRILFYSNSLTFLTACIHGMNQLLYPLHWQHIFVPVLPEDLIDYVCAPMPFVCGVPKTLIERIKKMPLDDIVIVDIDNSTIETPFKDVENIPKELIQPLANLLKKPAIGQDSNFPRAFLHFFACLLGNYRRGLRSGTDVTVISFDQEMFKQQAPSYMHNFIDNVYQLQMFDQFISTRLLYLKQFKDDPFEQESRNLKDPLLNKSTSQIFNEFGDKILDVSTEILSKINSIEIKKPQVNPSTKEFLSKTASSIKTVGVFLNKKVRKNLLAKNNNSFDERNSPRVPELNEFERQISTMSNRQSRLNIKNSIQRPTRDPPPTPLPYAIHKEMKSSDLCGTMSNNNNNNNNNNDDDDDDDDNDNDHDPDSPPPIPPRKPNDLFILTNSSNVDDIIELSFTPQASPFKPTCVPRTIFPNLSSTYQDRHVVTPDLIQMTRPNYFDYDFNNNNSNNNNNDDDSNNNNNNNNNNDNNNNINDVINFLNTERNNNSNDNNNNNINDVLNFLNTERNSNFSENLINF